MDKGVLLNLKNIEEYFIILGKEDHCKQNINYYKEKFRDDNLKI